MDTSKKIETNNTLDLWQSQNNVLQNQMSSLGWLVNLSFCWSTFKQALPRGMQVFMRDTASEYGTIIRLRDVHIRGFQTWSQSFHFGSIIF